MKTTPVNVVRLYLTEQGAHLEQLLARLHDEEQVKGVTVFRGITGFGASGHLHGANLLDLSLDLPIVVEFFDVPDKIVQVLEHLAPLFEPGHIVVWPAQMNVEAGEHE